MIINLFDNKESFLSVFTVVFTVIYAYAATFFLRRIRERRRQNSVEFYETLTQGLKDGLVNSLDDFVNLYKGVHGMASDDTSYRSGLVRRLRSYMVTLIARKTTITEAVEIGKIKDKLSQIIQDIEKNEPFVSLPNAERTLLTDVCRMIKGGDQGGAIQKMEDLAGLIEARQDSVDRLERSNKWAIPLAVIGLILTVVFGVISIVK